MGRQGSCTAGGIYLLRCVMFYLMENIQPMKYFQHQTHLSNKLIFLVNSISLSNKKYSSSLRFQVKIEEA